LFLKELCTNDALTNALLLKFQISQRTLVSFSDGASYCGRQTTEVESIEVNCFIAKRNSCFTTSDWFSKYTSIGIARTISGMDVSVELNILE